MLKNSNEKYTIAVCLVSSLWLNKDFLVRENENLEWNRISKDLKYKAGTMKSWLNFVEIVCKWNNLKN